MDQDDTPEERLAQEREAFVEAMVIPSKGHCDESGVLIPEKTEMEINNKIGAVGMRRSMAISEMNAKVDLDTAQRALNKLAETYPDKLMFIQEEANKIPSLEGIDVQAPDSD